MKKLMVGSFALFVTLAAAGIMSSSRPQPPNEGGPLPCPPPCSAK